MSYYNTAIALSTIIIIIGTLSYSDAYAVTYTITNGTLLSKSHLIGIQLSQDCLIMLKNGIKNNCLTYDKLTFLDNTNPLLSGRWVEKPFLHRDHPTVTNHYNFN